MIMKVFFFECAYVGCKKRALLPACQQPIGSYNRDGTLTGDKVLLRAYLRRDEIVCAVRQVRCIKSAHETNESLNVGFFPGIETGGGNTKALEYPRVDWELGFWEGLSSTNRIEDAWGT